MSAPIKLERQRGLAILTFDSPPLNLFDQPMMDALAAAIGELEAELPRAVLLKANGRAVSGGVDVGRSSTDYRSRTVSSFGAIGSSRSAD